MGQASRAGQGIGGDGSQRDQQAEHVARPPAVAEQPGAGSRAARDQQDVAPAQVGGLAELVGNAPVVNPADVCQQQ